MALARIDNSIDLLAEGRRVSALVAAGHLQLLAFIARCEMAEPWIADGCRDLAEWLSQNLGYSQWAARRLINATHALPTLPRICAAFEQGILGIDKVLELCRYATPETEARLIPWAQRVTAARIRRKADLANKPDLEDVKEADRARYLRYWWHHDNGMLELEGALPPEQGAVVAKALDRLAQRMPDIINDEGNIDRSRDIEGSLDARRADALVALASAAIAADQDADRATVVVHADLDGLIHDQGSCGLEHGPALHPETVRRLTCDSRLQVVLEDKVGNAFGIGRVDRNPPAWLQRQLRHRDIGCTFPGCGRKWFLHAHHIVHWTRGGPTDLDNLVLVCSLHHKLVHELGWAVELGGPGGTRWFRPDGRPFDPSPSPSDGERAPPSTLAV